MITTEQEAKRAFAELMLRHPGAFRRNAQTVAALGGIVDAVVVATIETVWPLDREVLQYRDELLEAAGGEDEFLPTKAQVALALWAIAEAPGDPETKIKALKEYSALRGFVEKPGAGVAIAIVNKVMSIRDHGDDEAWEKRLKANQVKLIEHVG